MSKKFREAFGNNWPAREEFRKWLQPKFEVDKNGKPVYLTEQSHKNECDVNKIIKKYDKTGLISHVSKFEAEFGDLSGFDFKAMQDKVAGAKSRFEQLPSDVRRRFGDDPGQLLSFMSNAANRDEAVKLGLIRNDWTPETDGIGEHVKLGENKTKEVSSE